MKTKLLLIALLWTSSALSGMTLNTISGGLLKKPDNEVSFNSGVSYVNLKGGEWFKMQGIGTQVDFGRAAVLDWSFDKEVIDLSDLSLADITDIKDSDILTIVGTANHNERKQYEISAIKYLNNNDTVLRVVSVQSIVPEAEAYALLAGLLSLCCVALRRRGLSA